MLQQKWGLILNLASNLAQQHSFTKTFPKPLWGKNSLTCATLHKQRNKQIPNFTTTPIPAFHPYSAPAHKSAQLSSMSFFAPPGHTPRPARSPNQRAHPSPEQTEASSPEGLGAVTSPSSRNDSPLRPFVGQQGFSALELTMDELIVRRRNNPYR